MAPVFLLETVWPRYCLSDVRPNNVEASLLDTVLVHQPGGQECRRWPSSCPEPAGSSSKLHLHFYLGLVHPLLRT